jgi:MFS family permease
MIRCLASGDAGRAIVVERARWHKATMVQRGSLRLVVALCAAHVLTMLGFSIFASLLPLFAEEWRLSATEAGFVSGAMFAGYTAGVPVLVSLTDRIDPRWVYGLGALAGVVANAGFALFAREAWSAALFHALLGASLAGTYMPGLKALSDHLAPQRMARAVAFYTSSFSLGGAISYVFADRAAAVLGWQAAFAGAAAADVAAALLVWFAVPRTPSRTFAPLLRAFDFRPVFRNRSAVAFSLGYAVHCWELFTFRSWIVAFLAAVAMRQGGDAGLAPSTLAAAATLIGMGVSIAGNEAAIRLGGRRIVSRFMVLSALAAFLTGLSAQASYGAAAALVLVYSSLIMGDSAALTAGALGNARAGERGITMAVHSTLGLAGAGLGPIAFGAILDWAGRGTAFGWWAAFAHLAVISLAGPLLMALASPGRCSWRW